MNNRLLRIRFSERLACTVKLSYWLSPREFTQLFHMSRCISEYRELANYSVINIGYGNYFVDSAVWKFTFPIFNFTAIDNIGYFTALTTFRRGINFMHVLIASGANALTKIPDQA
jgi:hypothetical protein